MTLNNNIKTANFCTAARISNPVQAGAAETARETVPPKGDGVDLTRGYDRNAIPADDDEPKKGGSEPTQDPAEADGPGAGGGYNSRDIPADDDGPGAGGGYGPDQDPAESDGPGAGGGYHQISSFSGPLTSFVTNPSSATWRSLFPEFPLSWSGSTLYLEAHYAQKIQEQVEQGEKSR